MLTKILRIAEAVSALCLFYFALASPLAHPLQLIIFAIEGAAACYVAVRLGRQSAAAVAGFVLACAFLIPVAVRVTAGRFTPQATSSPAYILSFALVGLVIVCQLLALVGTGALMRQQRASA